MRYLFHPLTLMNLCLVGFLGIIEVIHTYTHYKMEKDVHGYVHNFCRKNPDTCAGMIDE